MKCDDCYRQGCGCHIVSGVCVHDEPPKYGKSLFKQVKDLKEKICELESKLEISKNVIKNFDLEYKTDIQNRDEYLRQVGEF